MHLEEVMNLEGWDKAQLVQLCSMLYSLLQVRQPVPIVYPINPAPAVPLVYPTWWNGNIAVPPLPQSGITVCGESTQQERFGSK